MNDLSGPLDFYTKQFKFLEEYFREHFRRQAEAGTLPANQPAAPNSRADEASAPWPP